LSQHYLVLRVVLHLAVGFNCLRRFVEKTLDKASLVSKRAATSERMIAHSGDVRRRDEINKYRSMEYRLAILDTASP